MKTLTFWTEICSIVLIPLLLIVGVLAVLTRVWKPNPEDEADDGESTDDDRSSAPHEAG